LRRDFYLRAVIFANGDLNDPLSARERLQPDDLLIAADGGARHFLRLGITPHLVIGDFDSLDAGELDSLENLGVKLVRYPSRKDFTDLELAVRHAVEAEANEILILAALGARWDQTLANVLLAASHELRTANIRLVDGSQEIRLLRGGEKLELTGRAGDTVSLIPLGGDVYGVSTEGLEYPLNKEKLFFGSTRGVSNVMNGDSAGVSMQEGMLLCVLIHADA
jgi:thiamine pyrophosphokinase